MDVRNAWMQCTWDFPANHAFKTSSVLIYNQPRCTTDTTITLYLQSFTGACI
jgi:hypothetical protein